MPKADQLPLSQKLGSEAASPLHRGAPSWPQFLCPFLLRHTPSFLHKYEPQISVRVHTAVTTLVCASQLNESSIRFDKTVLPSAGLALQGHKHPSQQSCVFGHSLTGRTRGFGLCLTVHTGRSRPWNTFAVSHGVSLLHPISTRCCLRSSARQSILITNCQSFVLPNRSIFLLPFLFILLIWLDHCPL